MDKISDLQDSMNDEIAIRLHEQQVEDDKFRVELVKNLFDTMKTIRTELETNSIEGYLVVTVMKDDKTNELSSIAAHGSMSIPTLLGHLEIAKADILSFSLNDKVDSQKKDTLSLKPKKLN